MLSKEFDKGPLTVDAPKAEDYAIMEDDTDIGDGEIITDPHAKMRQLEEMAAKGLLVGNKS